MGNVAVAGLAWAVIPHDLGWSDPAYFQVILYYTIQPIQDPPKQPPRLNQFNSCTASVQLLYNSLPITTLV